MSDPTTNALERILRRLQMVVGIGRVRTGSDSGIAQMLQVQFDDADTRDNTPRIGEYGFTSMPRPGSHAIFICVGGDRSNGVIIGTNDPTARLKNLQSGEVAIYDDLGQSVYLTRSGIVVNGAGLPITVNGNTTTNGNATINGTLHVTGPITGDVTITAPTVTGTTDVVFGTHSGNAHVHSGVLSGINNTGAPV